MPDAAPPTAPATGLLFEAPPDARYCTLYHRDEEFAALAQAELATLVGGHNDELGLWISSQPVRWAQCGYGNGGGRLLAAAATLDALEQELRVLHLAAPRYSLRILRIPQNRNGATEAKVRIVACIDGAESPHDPLVRLVIVVSPGGFHLLVDDPARPGENAWLQAAHKLHNYLVALPVRIARAMLHLVARPGDSVLDPFCGSGTIPLVAAWAGHRAYGSDISAACVTRARANLEFFRKEAGLVCADAREAVQTADCIVTNLPYGLYSHFQPDALRAALHNLSRLAPRAAFVTSERIDDDLRAAGWELSQTIRVEPGRFERLVYVTRRAGT